jgi:hypothetical protein
MVSKLSSLEQTLRIIKVCYFLRLGCFMASAHEYLVEQFEEGTSRMVYKIRKDSALGLRRIEEWKEHFSEAIAWFIP